MGTFFLQFGCCKFVRANFAKLRFTDSGSMSGHPTTHKIQAAHKIHCFLWALFCRPDLQKMQRRFLQNAILQKMTPRILQTILRMNHGEIWKTAAKCARFGTPMPRPRINSTFLFCLRATGTVTPHPSWCQMSIVGFEPTRSCLQWILSPPP